MSDFSLPTDDDYPAISSAYDVIIEFLENIQDEVDKTEFDQLLFRKLTLDSEELDLRFKPHPYTRKNLVDPLLAALNLNHEPEPVIQGVDLASWPEFEVTNTGIPLIGEIKPVNAIGGGIDQIKRYLSAEACKSPYGILTDGIEWRVYGPPPRGGTGGYVIHESVKLHDTFQAIANRRDMLSVRGYSENPKKDILYPITQFVRKFQREHIDQWTILQLSKTSRERYVVGDIDFQQSLKDFESR